MANKFLKLGMFGITATALVFGMMVVSCGDDPGGNNGSIPSNAIQLTPNVWADGNIPASDGEQWFKFTAAAATQYIHIDFGTLTDLYVQLYDANGDTVGSKSNLYSYLSITFSYTSRPVTIGDTYYIKVTPYSDGYSGAYKIAFNSSTAAPAPLDPDADEAVTLAAGEWENGNITANGEEWFEFTADAATQYIHVTLGTLNRTMGLYAQVYDADGAAVGARTKMDGSTLYISQSVTIGQTYYIKVTPYSNIFTGTYQITFSASFLPPDSAAPAELAANEWADGNIPTGNDEEWFMFTATAARQYIHASFGTLNSAQGLYAQVYDANGATAEIRMNIRDSFPYIFLSVTIGQTYYIKVTPYSNSYSGTYKIAFSALSLSPDSIASMAGAVQLAENEWTNGSITAGGEKWFKFTATETWQYIHVTFVTLNSAQGLYAQVYDANGATVRTETNLNSATPSMSRLVTIGQTYYIRVTPYSSSYTGTYKIAFNDLSLSPDSIAGMADAVQLAANEWTDGSITAGGEQWFKFTATAVSQYIHVDFNTVASNNGLNVQLYSGNGIPSGNEANLSNNIRSTNRSVLTTVTYYIRVTSRSNSNGTYWITFNTSTSAPLSPAAEGKAVTLATDAWTDGNITAGADKWFKFTADAAMQYIHVTFGTLNSAQGLYAQVYDANGATVGTETNLKSATPSMSRSVTIGQTYYIRVTPYYSSYTGTYKIALNDSTTAPANP